MRNFLLLLIALITVVSCKKEAANVVDVSNIPVDFSVSRFEVDFYNASEKTLLEVKEKYPMMFSNQNDSVWINKINNKDEQELFLETQKVYKDFSEVKAQLENLFKHIKYYNPKFKAPQVITTISGIDYSNRVIYAGEFLVISLDVYLGKEHEFYNDYPSYIKGNNTKEHIIVDVSEAIINKQFVPIKERTFISKMIAEGKRMYLQDVYLPLISEREKMGYVEEKYNWILASEESVWRFFVEKDMLYSTSASLNKRFIDIAPFSKFYLENDRETPGRVGVWIGWQIVRAYMQNNDVSLRELMHTSAEEVFTKSKYKPRR